MAKIAINEFAKKAYRLYTEAGLTTEGACGLMGNQYAESAGFLANRVEFLCIKRLKEAGYTYTDESYTKAVDQGKLSCEQFLHPLPGKQYGYGLCQWTSPSRKAGLYNATKGKGISIADEAAQIEFTLKELRESYPKVLEKLKSTKSVKEASDIVLVKFEQPADTGASVKNTRYDYAKQYYDYFKGEKMTEEQARDKVVKKAESYLGCKESDGSHRKIIDLYNSHKPLARGYAVSYKDAWCATFVSAVAIALGYTDIMPTECGCEEMVRKYQKIGRWVENDAYIPKKGDIAMYDWQDSGKGDCTGEPDHVGIVVAVSGNTIKVIEGNKNDMVEYRNIEVNARYIRGYCTPDYKKKAKVEENAAQENKGPEKKEKEYYVQAGAFTVEGNAKKRLNEVIKKGFAGSYIAKSGGLYKIYTGAFRIEDNAKKQVQSLKKEGFEDAFYWGK